MISRKKTPSGFTLIEVLIVTVLTGMIGIGILSLEKIITDVRLSSLKNYLNVEEANSNIATLVREIRNIRPGDNAAYPLERAQDHELIFYSDIDYDGKTEKIRYSLTGVQFVKGIIEPTGFPATYPSGSEKVKVLTENVRNASSPIFYYYNGDWPQDTVNNPLATPARLSDTKLMKVYLRLNTKEDEESDFILESYVQLRMLKENL
ncbi:hypothetical protein A2686_03615 [Candidatus Woesebacteria bacterium RIFCSPHIGHO2_01_FULL_38_10]|uniref:Type II secretion system protein J n=1 Tax=Candidatus Woesebacteria bacterium RIFCSPLOWO2_01_FULL_39_10b TaxID=1802517 RepID=A0A1F8B8A3_9BACT|nr:MAG: hypothetical protein A2686_03615 [Candidatus Woesebacteria bacterium RIFCSPHIGHO2_01_FULL_38_10]OGM59655.1 MAG: hypothetical protein A2892_03970 [Candidatus Woesebacteria bacterium RIFCSPLOWO2_01_FULL_39_10b]